MASTNTKKQLMLIILSLPFFLPNTLLSWPWEHELPSPQENQGDQTPENQSGFSLKRSDSAPLNIKLYKEVISGHSGNVSVSPLSGGNRNYSIKVDFETEGSCPKDYQFTKLKLLGSGHMYFGNSAEYRVQHPNRTARVPVSNASFHYSTNELRKTCADNYNGNGTFTADITRYFKVTCTTNTGFGYEDKHSKHNVSIPLQVTCEDVLPPSEYRAKVSVGKVEYECPALTADQPQSGYYYDNFRIVVEGTPYGHFISNRLDHDTKIKCIRVKANDGLNPHGNSYFSPIAPL